MKPSLIIIFLTTLCFSSFTPHDVLAFRCGNGLVSTGETKTMVQMTCGKPTSKEKQCKGNRTSKKDKCEKVDVWYYNCGDNDFVYTLTFEDNILTGENTEGRGQGKSDCRGR